MKYSNYNILINSKNSGKTLIYNTFTGGILETDYVNQPFLLNQDISLLKSELREEMIKGGMIIDNDINEIEELRLANNVERYTGYDLGLTIAPSLMCNFRCPYCYEKGVNLISMNDTIENNVVEFVEKNLQKNLHITWYGGEPLLCIDRIESLTQKMKKLIPEEGIYSASMITNGFYLNKDMALTLRKNSINSVQITIDGTRDIHDSRRILKNGDPTYDIIFDNIINVCDDINIVIRINLDQKNCNRLEEFLKDIKERHLNKKVEVYIAKLDSFENIEEDNGCIYLGTQFFSKMEVELERLKEKYDMKIRDMPTRRFLFCSAIALNSYVIGPDGGIYKCWSEIGRPENSIGNVKNGVKRNDKFFKWVLYESVKDECKDCKVLPLCMGGCPYNRFYDKPVCVSYKYNIYDILDFYYQQNK